ncbi:MAG: hypothetical protein ACRDZO_10330, partial [Egibacteraceae bacterium]
AAPAPPESRCTARVRHRSSWSRSAPPGSGADCANRAPYQARRVRHWLGAMGMPAWPVANEEPPVPWLVTAATGTSSGCDGQYPKSSS